MNHRGGPHGAPLSEPQPGSEAEVQQGWGAVSETVPEAFGTVASGVNSGTKAVLDPSCLPGMTEFACQQLIHFEGNDLV